MISVSNSLLPPPDDARLGAIGGGGEEGGPDGGTGGVGGVGGGSGDGDGDGGDGGGNGNGDGDGGDGGGAGGGGSDGGGGGWASKPLIKFTTCVNEPPEVGGAWPPPESSTNVALEKCCAAARVMAGAMTPSLSDKYSRCGTVIGVAALIRPTRPLCVVGKSAIAWAEGTVSASRRRAIECCLA
jgi:hypothetical protein